MIFSLVLFAKCVEGDSRYGVENNMEKNTIEIKNMEGFLIGHIFPQAPNFLPEMTLGAEKKSWQLGGAGGKVGRQCQLLS